MMKPNRCLNILFALMVICLMPKQVVAAPGDISTIVGTGVAGFSGDGAAATAAQLNYSIDIKVDSSGNLFIADKSNNRVRKVDAATGFISTVAGNGILAISPDGTLATAGSIGGPTGISVDSTGNLFVVSQAFDRVFKVDAATGTITKVAGTGVRGFSGDGGAAIGAQLNLPATITVDATGNLFIVDTQNHRIRKVDVATGVISTVAGTGVAGFSGDGAAATAAQLNTPAAIRVDSTGNLFIADNANNRIRKVDAATGFIATVAGAGAAGFSGDGGLATAANINSPNDISLDNAGNLFIADSNNHRIRKVDVATGIISTVAGTGVAGFSGDGAAATAAQLNMPISITVDSLGNLFTMDRLNQRIRKVEGLDATAPTGTISINAGNGFTNTTAVTLTLTCTDITGAGVSQNAGTGCSQMQFSNDNVTWSALTANAASSAWTLAAGANGVRTVYARFKDAAGNVSTAVSDTITVDTLAPGKPAITAPANNTLTNNTARPIISGTAEPAATVNVKDGATSLGMLTATGGSWSLASGGATLTPGAHNFTAIATDAAGNVGPASTAITYTVDTTAPTLTSVGIASNNGAPTLAKAGDVVTLSFTASETLGALPTATIATKAATVTNTGGNNYTATYTMLAADTQGTVAFTVDFTDAAGNAGTQVIAVTNGSSVAFDSAAPAIATPGNVTVEATATSGAAKTNVAIAAFLNSATTTGATTAVAANNAPVIFPLGITTVTFTAVDAAGNSATPVNATVTVVDTSPPAILGAPLADVTAEATGANTAVTLIAPTATDLFAVTITNNAPAAGFPVGITIVIWTARDANGNASTTNQNVIISDTTAPVITLTGSNPGTITAGATYADAGATAIDLVDGNMTGSITVVNPVPNPATEGIFTVTYNVSDAAGNAATQVTRTVRVAATTTSSTGSVDLLSLTGTAGTVNIVSTGEALFGLTATATTANAPANVNFPFGVIDYSTSVTGASKTVRLTFSTPLPANPVLYKVDGAGAYALLPTSLWTKIDANTIDITLTDGSPQTDLDGVVNGVIHDPLAVGGTPVATSNGGCVINPTASFDPVMLMILLLASAYEIRARKSRTRPRML